MKVIKLRKPNTSSTTVSPNPLEETMKQNEAKRKRQEQERLKREQAKAQRAKRGRL